MAAENLDSTSITNLDSSPVVENTRGTGAPAYSYTIDDTVTCTASGIGTVGSTYRMVRFPSNAKIKGVHYATSVPLDTNSSPALAIDFNICFSDSTTDGTQAEFQGQIPTTAGNTVTPISSYSSPNKLFGTYTVTSHTAGVLPQIDLTLNGITSTYPLSEITSTELWSLFGFENPYGVALDPGGFFDLLLYVSTAAATGAAGILYTKVDFVV